MNATTENQKQAVAISGASGLVGSALSAALQQDGLRVIRLSRSPGPDTVVWDPDSGVSDASPLEGVRAVVHLAGENIASGRWTDAQKKRIRDSRVEGTRHLCRSLATLRSPPKVFVCASAIGYYGDRGDELLDESSSAGTGFLADVCREWEAAAAENAPDATRVVQTRFGVILSKAGGALQKMLTPFKMGVGGRVGSGKQYWSWVALPDVVGSIQHAIATEALSGPVNVVAPQPVTNAEFTKVLASVLHRPAFFPMPAVAARLALGEMADELLMASARVAPRKLEASRFVFQFCNLEGALRDALK